MPARGALKLGVHSLLGIKHSDTRLKLFFGFFLRVRLLSLFALGAKLGELGVNASLVFPKGAEFFALTRLAASGAV
jgi:hypothetical protein